MILNAIFAAGFIWLFASFFENKIGYHNSKNNKSDKMADKPIFGPLARRISLVTIWFFSLLILSKSDDDSAVHMLSLAGFFVGVSMYVLSVTRKLR